MRSPWHALTQMPLLPLVLEGTADALPKRGFVLQGRHRIRVRVLPEIPYARFADQSVQALTEEVHALFAAELGELRSAMRASA
jgi:1-acyl-sn-glycerol-3-phosphate acyltransferase